MLRFALRTGRHWVHTSRQKFGFSVKNSLLAEKHSASDFRTRIFIQNEGQNVGHLPKVPEIFATRIRLFSVIKENLSDTKNQDIKTFSNASGVTRWIPRSQVEEEIITNFKRNELNFLIRSTRFNDYAGLVISGGIGSGKTRAGQEIPNIIAPLAQKLGYFAAVYHLMINLHQTGYPTIKGYTDATVRPANVRKTNTRIGRWFTRQFATAIGADPSVMDLQRLVYALQQRDQLPPNKKIVLYLHVDEFQEAPYICLGLTRYLTDFISTRTPENSQWFDNLVVIPVFTGTAPSALLEGIWQQTSSYGIQLVQLKNETSTAWLHGLADKFIELLPDSRRAPVNMAKKEAPHQYEQLLMATGGIPKFIQTVVLQLASSDNSPGPVQTLVGAFNRTVNELHELYPPLRLNSWFREPSHLKKFLRLAFFKVPVTRQTHINGQTVAELELAGFIYLTPVGTDLYTISSPLLMIHYFERFARINMLSNRQLLKHPFNIVNENDFATLIAEIYAFSIELLAHESDANTTVREFHRGCIAGTDSLLAQSLSFKRVEKFVSVDEMQPIDANPIGPTNGVKLIGREEPIDLLDPSKNLVIKTMPRYPGPDIILPGKLQVQLKWSLYITSLMPVPAETSATTVINLGLVQAEANKSSPDFPLVIITPKRADPKLLTSITTDASLSNVALITDGDCRAFLLPFYLHPTK